MQEHPPVLSPHSVSCISGTIRLVLDSIVYSKPESGVHVRLPITTEMMTCDWSLIIAYVLMCFLVVI